MADPTNPNPNPNQDSTRSQTTENPNSWASPKDGDGDGLIKLQSDDIQPERKIRLGQYLSDMSSGRIHGPDNDNSNGRSSQFPIENPEPTEYSPFMNTGHSYTGLLEDVAKEYFQNLSSQSSFIPGVGSFEGGAKEGPIRFQDGNDVLSQGTSIVEAHMSHALSEDTSSRWAGIGVERFKPDIAQDRYQVQRAGPHLDGTLLDDTKGSRFQSFEHKTGATNFQTLSNTSFWDEYFEDLRQIGPRITLAASGHKDPTIAADGKRRGNTTANAGAVGSPEGMADLTGDYSKVPLTGLQPGNAFDPVEEFSNMEINELPTMSSQSWGQLYSWAAPYESNTAADSLTIAAQLLEIWAMVQLRILIITTLFQGVSMVLSTITTPTAGNGFFNRRDLMRVPWNRNYYPENVQVQPGTAFDMGKSGFNHSPVNLIQKGLDGINEFSAKEFNNYAAFLVPQLLGGAVNQVGKSVEEEILNFTSKVLKEVNVYIPRHTLSTSANVSGYLEDDVASLNFLLKFVDVSTAYTRATAAGMGTLASYLIASVPGITSQGDFGYWRNIFREVVRSKAYMQQLHVDNPEEFDTGFEYILKYVGKGDKIMRFVNYLAQIGDMSIGRGFAGKLAFPENKVELKNVANFPTLRTAANRQKGTTFGNEYKSRLSLTETPSLYLLPKSIKNIRLGLQDARIQAENTVWGSFSGGNELHNKAISEEDKKANSGTTEPINERWQARAGNRFSASQVRRIEDQLEAEHMPFYIQDLRTNEIVSFHAFLTSISDSYTGEWSAQKGFGRLEAAQIYGGGSRSIAVSFMMVPMNKEDYDEMWVKVNKLSTLVYPQWSEGTTISTGEGTFVQPFSQVPTASPLCRLRVGDLFTSNYSKTNMARMMGIGKTTFSYGNSPRRDNTLPTYNSSQNQKRFINPAQFKDFIKTVKLSDRIEARKSYQSDPTQFELVWDREMLYVQIPGLVPLLKEWIPCLNSASWKQFSTEIGEPAPIVTEPDGGTSMSKLFSNENPIIKSFESTMGRGIAVAVTGITFDWKLNSVPWDLEPGQRAPRQCEVQLSIVPIHDITPGLDHEGFNRAPIYTVGQTMRSVGGDPWYNNSDHEDLIAGIEEQHQKALEGKDEL